MTSVEMSACFVRNVSARISRIPGVKQVVLRAKNEILHPTSWIAGIAEERLAPIMIVDCYINTKVIYAVPRSRISVVLAVIPRPIQSSVEGPIFY